MWRSLPVIAIASALSLPAVAGIRAPSCQALTAFALGARVDPIEQSFGKSPGAMSVDEFDQALDIVRVCLDAAEASPPDIPGLWLLERRRTKIIALSSISEDLRLYRNRLRDRERRAARESN